MKVDPKVYFDDNSTISDVFRYLVKQSGKDILTISEETKLPSQTLYALHSRKSKRADIKNLKVLADYFGVDITIFCGLAQYEPPRKLSMDEISLLDKFNTLSSEAQRQLLDYIDWLRSRPENVVKLI